MMSPTTQAILDALLEDPDSVQALVVPYGLPAAERALQLDHHGAVVRELREAGYPVDVIVRRADNGEVFAIALTDGIVDDQVDADGKPL